MAEASTAKSPAPRKKIKYATGEDEAPINPGRSLMTHPGADIPWRENPDNPLSPDYIPVSQRTEQEKARWWALQSRRKQGTEHGVY